MAMDISRRGLLLILSSPSGAGKTTISRAILEGDAGIELSVSVTTRPPRPGEVDGEDYHFIDEPAFRRMVAEGRLLEHALVFGNSYGTPREAVEKAVTAGRDVLFDVDWQGTQQLTENARGDVASIFVLPPSMAALEDRLRHRAQDADAEVAKRMSEAEAEMSHWPEYDYVIVNRDFDRSVQAVQTILAAERLRRERQVGLTDFIGAMRGG
ncbi:MAG: guanylate kinase [Rhodospirillales bacterium]|jgi:guanylate kinase|nr:guanylate kinase [Rhodospirillales bacterium]